MEIAVRANAKLAEGPRWDAATQRLLWVDIEGCELHVLESGEDRSIRLDTMVGAAAATTGGSVLVALADRLALVDLAGESVSTLIALPHGPGMRSNDGACDAAGRFWIGTMALGLTPGAAALYCYDGKLRRVLDGVTLSNGLGWTRDDTQMYYIDSTEQRVDIFDFELASGQLDRRRPFVSIDRSDGIPDGLTVDHEGGVWVALYGGSCVRRYDEGGRLDAVVEVPAENVTSCCFGGEDGRSLFVTTAAPDGNVYVTQPGVSGPSGARLSRGRDENGSVGRGRHERPVAGEHTDVIAWGRGLPADETLCQLRSSSSTMSVPLSTSIAITSPSCTTASGPPRAASGATCPTISPRVAPEKRPSVTRTTDSPMPLRPRMP